MRLLLFPKAYFGALHDIVKNPAAVEAVYLYLMNLDLTGFNPRNIPDTDTKADMMVSRWEIRFVASKSFTALLDRLQLWRHRLGASAEAKAGSQNRAWPST